MEEEKDIEKQEGAEEQSREPSEEAEGVTKISEPQNKPLDWPRIILFTILGVLVLGGVAYGGYWYATRSQTAIRKPASPAGGPQTVEETPTLTPQPTPTPSIEEQTKDWKRYRNETYNYEIKCPSDWVLKPDKQVPEEIVGFTKDLNHLTIYAGSSHTGVPEGKVPSKVRSITVGGVEATKEIYEGLFEWIKFPEGLAVNQMTVRYKDGIYNSDYARIFDLMLQTFKFSGNSNFDCQKLETLSMEELTQVSEAGCEECNGKWELLSMDLSITGCNPRTSDAGKSCTRNDQCVGQCLAKDEMDLAGTCSEYKYRLGCSLEFDKGEPVGICRD